MNFKFKELKQTKNLLAFSAGVDSTALFFLLLKEAIPFDIAIVNYNTREQSKKEVEYAKDLAKKHNKKIFIHNVTLEDSNFEKEARDIRYSYFEQLVQNHNYKVLITAHQLNDKLEWFMMQLSRGAGVIELMGLNTWEERSTYKLYRPLLDISKNELENYLKANNHKYFIDSSNYDQRHKRNYFRHNFTDKFLEEYKDGIKNSFKYIQKDIASLEIDSKPIFKYLDFELYEKHNDNNINIRVIDKALKRLNVLISSATRKEILEKKELIVSHTIAISITDTHIWISPNSGCIMDKKFKEKCRLKKIPKNIRAYLFECDFNIDELII